MFRVGDKVKYKGNFLRSIGWYTDVPKDGIVVDAKPGNYVRVLWNEFVEEPLPVHVKNITLANKADNS